MILNDAGKMIAKWYDELENKYPDIRCHEMIIMPNHFHCIVENVGTLVGADLRVCPDETPTNGVRADLRVCPDETPTNGVRADLRVCPDEMPTNGVRADLRVCPDEMPTNGVRADLRVCPDEMPILGEHAGSPLHRVVQWFKTMTTNEYIRGVKTLGWTPFGGKLWQRNYWEHIIRNENEYNRIAEYINNNPQNWDNDTLK
jgi:REP element-mobilizing transposase RayT